MSVLTLVIDIQPSVRFPDFSTSFISFCTFAKNEKLKARFCVNLDFIKLKGKQEMKQYDIF